MKRLTLSLCLCVSVGCASTLEAAAAPAEMEEGFEPSGDSFLSKTHDKGVTETIVDSTSDTAWHRFDLDTGMREADEAKWDLEFNRFKVRSNGGVSGGAGVEVALLKDEAFEEVSAAPSDGYEADPEDGPDDENTDPDNKFNGPVDAWYDYNLKTHTLSPRKGTYVVRSSEERYFKLGFDSYYDKAGSPAHVRFRWAELEED